MFAKVINIFLLAKFQVSLSYSFGHFSRVVRLGLKKVQWIFG